MLDRLPPEIIDHILLIAAAPPRLDDYSGDSQEALSRCCLISKVLRERAQPLLWRDVTLWRPEQFEAFVRLRPLQETDDAEKDDEDADRLWRLRRTTRVLRLQEVNTAARSFRDYNGFFALLTALPPFLTSMKIGFDAGDLVTPFQLTELSSAASVLRSMNVWQQILEGATLVFPALVSLYLDGVRASSATFAALLSQSTLPALGRSTLVAMGGDKAFVALTAAFLSQLELLEVDVDGVRYIPDDIRQKPFALVIKWMFYGEHRLLAGVLSSSTTPNLHLHLVDWEPVHPSGNPDNDGRLEDVVAALSTLPQLRAFHCSHPPSSYDPKAASIRCCLSALITAAANNGAEVFDANEDVWDVVKRMKVKKEIQEKEEAEQA